jgi:hypothetical protein
MVRKKMRVIPVVSLFAVVVTLIAVACGGEAQTESSASQESIEQLNVRMQYSESLHAMLEIAEYPIHEIEESVTLDDTIESSFVPDTREVIRVIALTDWLDELAADAEEMEAQAVVLLHALQDDDIAAAEEASNDPHQDMHAFDTLAWSVLAEDLPIDAGGQPR